MQSLLEYVMLLRRVPFFQLLRTDQLRYVVPLLEPVGWVAGSRVFDMGEVGSEMYIIVRGRVGVSIHADPAMREFVIELKEGECFGEMGILDDQPRSATVHVLEDTEALALGKEKLHGLLLAYPELGLGMLRAMGRRLREVSTDLARCRQDACKNQPRQADDRGQAT